MGGSQLQIHTTLRFRMKSIEYLVCAQSLPILLQPTRILCPWNFLGQNIGVRCHFLLQGISLTQGLSQTASLLSPVSAGRFIYHCTTWEALRIYSSALFILEQIQMMRFWILELIYFLKQPVQNIYRISQRLYYSSPSIIQNSQHFHSKIFSFPAKIS